MIFYAMKPQKPTAESPEAGNLSRRARKPHRKSRAGCLGCKRRKCDEEKPACANCIRFDIPCSFVPLHASSPEAPSPGPSGNAGVTHSAAPFAAPRRGPGRPRKDWATLAKPLVQAMEKFEIRHSSPTPLDAGPCSLNTTDAELLLHYTSHTAATLHDSDDLGADIAVFWARNVPQMGLSYPSVLQIACALSGYHRAHSQQAESDTRAHYLSVARHYAETGLSDLYKTHPNINESNCGALYVAAMLLCYCAFAAGPTGPNDLLICNAGDGASPFWLPRIQGVRLIRQMIEPATLFTGLTAPLASPPGDSHDQRPMSLLDEILRAGWIDPLERLRKWIASHDSPNTLIYIQALASLSTVYETNYGTSARVHEGYPDDRPVLGWLYRLQDLFVAHLQRKEPQALLILAYYVPLLMTLRRCWFLDGWANHLLASIRGMLSQDLESWLEWPLDVCHEEISVAAS
ncbi:hypothetical protein AK830_g11279 [Neonectria ditissima]|uniref:Zn(2)-C6 fungal-type domain-containing protein n=1 Tax=Neonectria ditissima TaxID=78410 RepID=A0A0P7ADE3_9HYPO|nr:hypothetical protein AK830_g11279 [Neonectria ditissima]